MNFDTFKDFSTFTKNQGAFFSPGMNTDKNVRLMNQAQALGINVGKFCSIGTNGEIQGLTTTSLNAAITQARQQEKAREEEESDTFTKHTEDKNLTDNEKETAKNNKNEVDTEYKDALLQYANSFNKVLDTNNEEHAKIDKEWDDINETILKFTGVSATETNALKEGREFIDVINKFVNKAQDVISEEEKAEKINMIEDDYTNPFSGIFFKSAENTFLDEDKKERRYA